MNEKLTAYALNELPPDERAELEAQMKDDPELRKEAEEMKDFCAMLGDELHADVEDETLKPEQRSKLVQSFQSTERKVVRPLWRKPTVLSSLGLAAAACVALFFTLHGLNEVKIPAPQAKEPRFAYAENEKNAQMEEAKRVVESKKPQSSEKVKVELAAGQKANKNIAQQQLAAPTVAAAMPEPAPTLAAAPATPATSLPIPSVLTPSPVQRVAGKNKTKLTDDQSRHSASKDAKLSDAPAEYYTHTTPLPNNGGNPNVTLSNGSLTYSSVGKGSLPGVSVDGMILTSTNPTSGGSHVSGSGDFAFPNRAKTAEPPLLTGSGGVLSPKDPSPPVAFNQMQAANPGVDHFESGVAGASASTVVKSGAGVMNVPESLQYAGTVAPPAPPTHTFRVEPPESKLIGGWTAPVEAKVPLVADPPITGGLFASSSSVGKTDDSSSLLAANSGSAGSGGVATVGAGTLTISGANSYTGGTNLNAGTFTIGGFASAPIPPHGPETRGTLTAGENTSTATSTGGTNANNLLIAGNSVPTITIYDSSGATATTPPTPSPGHFKRLAGDSFEKKEAPKLVTDAGGTVNTPSEIVNPTTPNSAVKAGNGAMDALRKDHYDTAARRNLEEVEQRKSQYFDAARDHTRGKMLNEVNRGWEDQVPAKIAQADKTKKLQRPEIAKAEKTADALPGAAPAAAAAAPADPAAAPAAPPMLAQSDNKPASTLPPVVAMITKDDDAVDSTQPTGGATRAPSDPEFDHHKELTDKISDLKKETEALPENTPERAAKDGELKGKYRELRDFESKMNLRRQRADEERRLAEETERLRRLEEQREAEERARREGPTTATYRPITENPFTFVQRQPFSTFSIDVDTASYANVRRFLDAHQRPPADAVRLEEMINYFPYSYSPPKDDRPFSVKVDMADAPWQPLHRIARVAIKGREMKADERPAANFTFLLDVSGSMSPPERLPLVKQALRLLVEQLREDDRVSIVTYAGESGLAMESTGGDHKEEILQAIEALHAGGSTNGAGGIRLAYEQAVKHFRKNGINRVILCTDGDFNVGMSSVQELERLIAEKAKTGVFLSVLGVGTDNLHDHTMQTLADRGNGNYHYLDSLSEARKVLVDQLTGTLVTIAKDVKIQIEFNPTQVAAYRLIGYEKRMLATQDFNNDKKDAGEIGAGHTITALYEIVPAKMKYPDGQPVVDERRYGKPAEGAAALALPEEPAKPEAAAHNNESMTVKLRYKEPSEDKSKLISVPVTDSLKTLGQNDHDFQFAAAVAGFGMLLRESPYGAELSWDSVRELARSGKGSDPQGWRGEFIQLIDRARGIYGDPK